MCANVIDQISENDVELKRCLTCYHIDYFLYKLDSDKFARLFELLTTSTGESERIRELLADNRSARAYDACILLSGEKAKKSTSPTTSELLKTCLTTLADFFLAHLDDILETQTGVFALRSFVKVIGQVDPIEAAAAAAAASSVAGGGNQKPKRAGAKLKFSMKTYEFKCLPQEWQFNEYLKKLVKKIKDKNILGIFTHLYNLFNHLI